MTKTTITHENMPEAMGILMANQAELLAAVHSIIKKSETRESEVYINVKECALLTNYSEQTIRTFVMRD
jgi:hypothetical protein